MIKLAGIFTLTILALSVIYHGLTFIPGISISKSMLFPLGISIFPAYGLMVINLRRIQNAQSRSPRATKLFFDYLSPRLRMASLIVFMYFAISFALFFFHTSGAGLVQVDGRYELRDRSKTIGIISEHDFYQFQAYDIRGRTAAYIFFTWLPAIYFLRVLPAMKAGKK